MPGFTGVPLRQEHSQVPRSRKYLADKGNDSDIAGGGALWRLRGSNAGCHNQGQSYGHEDTSYSPALLFVSAAGCRRLMLLSEVTAREGFAKR